MNRKRKYSRREDVLRWLEKKGLSQVDFARSLGLGVKNPVMTTFYWIHRGMRPHQLYMGKIAEKYPDCPLLRAAR